MFAILRAAIKAAEKIVTRALDDWGCTWRLVVLIGAVGAVLVAYWLVGR